MSWREDLRRASWRGLEFEALNGERTLGRDVAIHEFPQRDAVVGEDIRLATRAFSLEAYLIGDNYHNRRDAFEAALETAGTGILVTPWKGRITARLAGPVKATESTKEGGMVRYSLSFVEETATTGTTAVSNTKALGAAAAAAVHAQAINEMTARFSVANLPASVAAGAQGVMGKLSDRFDSLTAGLKGAGATLSGYITQGMALRAGVMDLVQKPIDLAARISGLVKGIRTVAATPGDALNALKSMLGFGDDLIPVSGVTPARIAESTNRTALVDLVQRSAAAEIVLAVGEIEFVAYQEAVAVRDALAESLDDLATRAGDAGDDDAWRVLVQVRSALIADITARGGSLRQLTYFTLPATTSALVLAHRLYPDGGDIEGLAEDIIARNAIEHPGFVPAGLALEVLADA